VRGTKTFTPLSVDHRFTASSMESNTPASLHISHGL
jgi:hypothetical protein